MNSYSGGIVIWTCTAGLLAKLPMHLYFPIFLDTEISYEIEILPCEIRWLFYPIESITCWSNGSNYAGYREYKIYKLLEALELLFNTYIQFNGSIFKQILGIPMGGNASPFIADLYLSLCEYCYMTKVVKTDYTLAKLLSYKCRYLDDICTINLQNFGDIAIVRWLI